MRSDTPLRYKTIDDMIVELGAHRFILRGYTSRSQRLSVETKCWHLETELAKRGLSAESIKAIN